MMDKERYSSPIINGYLLGSLPEAETEALDELSVTDDRFADALRVAEKDLVDAYVQGELSGSESERFESHYMTSPRRLEKVRFAQALRAFADKGAAAVAPEVTARAATDRAAEPAPQRDKSRWFSNLNIFAAPGVALRWGAAFALLVLLVASGWLVSQNIRLREQVAQTEARREALARREAELQQELEGQRNAGSRTEEELARVRAERERLEQDLKQQEAERRATEQRAARQTQGGTGGGNIASFMLMPQVRGTDTIQTVSITPRTSVVALRLELEPNDFPAYKVSLLDQSGNQTLWLSGQVRARGAGANKSLGIHFSALLLKPRPYLLRVTGVRADGSSEILSDYSFRVVK